MVQGYIKFVHMYTIPRRTWDKSIFYSTNPFRITFYTACMSMCEPFLLLLGVQPKSCNFGDTLEKFGTLMCFGPKTKAIENGADRTVSSTTSHRRFCFENHSIGFFRVFSGAPCLCK